MIFIESRRRSWGHSSSFEDDLWCKLIVASVKPSELPCWKEWSELGNYRQTKPEKKRLLQCFATEIWHAKTSATVETVYLKRSCRKSAKEKQVREPVWLKIIVITECFSKLENFAPNLKFFGFFRKKKKFNCSVETKSCWLIGSGLQASKL